MAVYRTRREPATWTDGILLRKLWAGLLAPFMASGLKGDQQQSAAFFAAGHDGGVEALAEIGGKVVDLVGTIDLYGFAGSVEDDFAVAALVKMLFDLGTRFSGNGVVNHVVEQGDKFGAGHASTPNIRSPEITRLELVRSIWRSVIFPPLFLRAPIPWTRFSS